MEPMEPNPTDAGSRPPTPRLGPKNPWLAGILSLFPGLGNVYNGLYARGVTFFLLAVLTIYLASHGSDLWGMGVAFVWLFNVVDAYRQAMLINLGYADDPALARRLGGAAAAREKLFAGTVLLIIGVLALFDRFFPFYLDRLLDFWPVAFIAAGAWLIWKALQAKGRGASEEPGGGEPLA
jgi:LiaI-LiaF-like transmembrane region